MSLVLAFPQIAEAQYAFRCHQKSYGCILTDQHERKYQDTFYNSDPSSRFVQQLALRGHMYPPFLRGKRYEPGIKEDVQQVSGSDPPKRRRVDERPEHYCG